ncbi:SRPBCC family protein [Conexibacter sp. SYSU D00693]|uniref:SRPBCC family protein n=1 Tax=Conexibacter sp. SYSU D00693 TaxID=2812560 RepID=UPI00196B8428|nr:SRPBCC family protein [Conexibacter sp. SYSU D00693]
MGRVRASIDVPGRPFDAEALWYDTARWPTFVDGLHHVARQDAGWPREVGARVVWDSTPGGRGRVVEVVEAFEQRTGQTAFVEDEHVRGTQRVAFTALDGDRTRVEIAFEYTIKRRGGWTPLVDMVFVRRPFREALERTLTRFARELRADRDLLA